MQAGEHGSSEAKLMGRRVGLEWQNEGQSCNCVARLSRLGLESGG